MDTATTARDHLPPGRVIALPAEAVTVDTMTPASCKAPIQELVQLHGVLVVSRGTNCACFLDLHIFLLYKENILYLTCELLRLLVLFTNVLPPSHDNCWIDLFDALKPKTMAKLFVTEIVMHACGLHANVQSAVVYVL